MFGKIKAINKGDTVGSLTSTQIEILIGSLLGDGTLRKQGTRTNALFEVNHSLQFSDYVDWKYEFFKEYVKTPPKSRKSNGNRIAYRFTTQSLPVFTEYYDKYYSLGKKIIPSNIKLTNSILAVWFMDDGSKTRNSFYINTQQFDIESQLLLIKCLERDFGIKSTLNSDKQYKRIRIRTESAKQLKNIVAPFTRPCFYYKLTMTP